MALTACGGGTDSDPTTIGVTVSNATDAYVVPWLVGQRQKFFENHGVTVSKVVAGKGGSTTLQTQLSGDLPIGEVGYPSVVQAKAKGAPVVAIGGATRTTYSLDFYTMASNTQVSTIKDIKKWGYTNQGSVTQALTYLLPQRAGIPDNDVQRVATGGFGEGIALLESGEIDAAAVAPSTIAANPSKFKLVVSSESLLKEFQQSVITTTTSFSKEHPKVVEAVLAGYTDSVTWIAGHVDEAAQIYSDHTHIPLPAAKQIVQGAVAADHWGVGLNKTGLDNAAAALKISGYQGPIDYCTLFDLSFLPAGQTAQLPTPCPQGAK
jgi:NitT/TauT family transport system substrate-binding protein